MATSSSTATISMRNQQPNLPPRRGQIKAQIFESVADSVISMALKAGEALIKLKDSGSGGGTSSSSAAHKPKSYNSDP